MTAEPWEKRGSRFGQVKGECPRDGKPLVYKYGNWWCEDYQAGCGWTTRADDEQGTTTLERCPACGGVIVYNGNYFCQHWGGSCDWALPAWPYSSEPGGQARPGQLSKADKRLLRVLVDDQDPEEIERGART